MAEKLSMVLPVPDLAAAVAVWTEVLGTDPTFVDGDRWAQFDHAGARLALAGTDRTSDQPGVMVKVKDLDDACGRLRKAGCSVGEPSAGAHERRATATGPGGWPIILYSPL
jgi:catechol 2,3-dioxygenase-like lactoylglutathione lyase family enzyme